MEDFPERLRHYMALQGVNQRDLARMLELTPATVCFYLQGKRCPHAEVMSKMASALGVSLLDLAGETFWTEEELNHSVRLVLDGVDRLSSEEKTALVKAMMELA